MIATGQFASLRTGVRLHYASVGERDAVPLLLLHGFPEYWAAWEDVLPRVADEFHAVAPDLRGFNLSDQPTDVASYRAREIVADLEALSDHLGWESCNVIAHDWGGAAAWQWAIAYPRRVKRLVMLNSPHPVAFARALAASAEQRSASWYINWLRSPDAEALLVEDDFRRLDGFFESEDGQRPQWYTPERATRYRAVWQRGLTGGLNYYRASPLHPPETSRPESVPILDAASFRVRVPTLVIWGDRDRALLPLLLDDLPELVDDLTIERLPDASHWLAHEKPDAVAAMIRSFCVAR